MNAHLIIRFNAAGSDQTHVDGCTSCAAHTANTAHGYCCTTATSATAAECERYPCTGMQRTFLRLEKILSTASASLLDPNSVAMMDCLMSDGHTGQNLSFLFPEEQV